MTLIGNVGRWHGGRLRNAPVASDDERHLRNEIARHKDQLDEWLFKRGECAVAITNHRAAIRKLAKKAKRMGVEL